MGLTQTQKDLVGGSVGGIAQVLVGQVRSPSEHAHPSFALSHASLPPRKPANEQPFDIVKVRLQTNPSAYASPVDCAKQILRADGPLGFYKGTLTPLLGIGACVSIQFGALEWAKRQLSGSLPAGAPLGLPALFAAGAFAGVANTAVAGPVEHIRIRLQTAKPGQYRGPLDVVRSLYAQGGVPAVFKGQGATMLRDGVGYG